MNSDILINEEILELTQVNSYLCKIWEKVDDIPDEWDALVADKDLFLSTKYLCALEDSLPTGMNHYYIGFYKNNKFIGSALFQTTKIKSSEAYRPKYQKTKGIKYVLERYIKANILKLFNFKVLVAGNLMLTGEHSYFYNSNEISKEEFHKLWYNSVVDLKKNKFKPNLTLLKDFFENKKYDFFEAKKDRNVSYSVDPNMILHLKPEWSTINDYCSVLKKKYRARIKTARKKIKPLTSKSLTYSEIISNRESIFNLYKSVSDNASFNTFVLHPDYFIQLKKTLKDDFYLIAYFSGEKIVGFFTVILNQNDLVTHFLGYCPIYNKKHQIYLNMLIDMVEIGLKEHLNNIVFGRTALEIKSTLGAVPYEMEGFMKYENLFLNEIAFYIFKFLNQNNNWIQRKPFKVNK